MSEGKAVLRGKVTGWSESHSLAVGGEGCDASCVPEGEGGWQALAYLLVQVVGVLGRPLA